MRAIAIVWEWLTDPFRDEEPLDVPIGLEDIHELAGGKLPEPRRQENPPPGGYYLSGEWRDPKPGRNFNVDPDDPELGRRLRCEALREWQ